MCGKAPSHQRPGSYRKQYQCPPPVPWFLQAAAPVGPPAPWFIPVGPPVPWFVQAAVPVGPPVPWFVQAAAPVGPPVPWFIQAAAPVGPPVPWFVLAAVPVGPPVPWFIPVGPPSALVRTGSSTSGSIQCPGSYSSTWCFRAACSGPDRDANLSVNAEQLRY